MKKILKKIYFALILVLLMSFKAIKINADTQTVLAVMQDSFPISQMSNFRFVGSAYSNGTGVYLVTNSTQQAGSFFTNTKVFLPNTTTAGFSTYFEMQTIAGQTPGDGFTFVVSKNTNVLGSTGGAIGYGGIDNSVAVMFDSYDNGGQPPVCISLGIDGVQQNCQYYSAATSATYRVWVDYSKVSMKMEVRINTSNNIRPTTPTVTYSNLDLSNIGNEFYSGFTSSTGAATQTTYLKKWYFQASFSSAGLDPNSSYTLDNTKPLTPSIVPIGYDSELDGWTFNAIANPDDLSVNPYFTYSFNGNTFDYNESSYIPNNVTSVSLYRLSDSGYLSDPAILNFYKAYYVLNYVGSNTIIRNYPEIGEYGLYIPSRPGYAFLGWTATPNYDPEQLLSTSEFPNNKIFFAHWEPTPFTVEFITDGGTSIDALSINADTLIQMPNDPVKPHYIFAGWYEDPLFMTPFDSNAFIIENKTLYAKWNIDQFTVSYIGLEDGTLSLNQDYNSQIVNLGEVTKTNCFFDGWYEDLAYEHIFDFNKPLTESTNLYVKWVDAIPVKLFESSINELPLELTTEFKYQSDLIQLRYLYQTLSEDQLRFLNPNYERILADYETKMLNMLAAEQVTAKIEELPWIPNESDTALVIDVYESYLALTEAQKSLLSVQSIHKLFDVSQQVETLNNAIHMSEIIFSLEALNYDNMDDYEQALIQFNALPVKEQALVDPKAKSILLNWTLNKTAYENVLNILSLLENLPNDVTLNNLSEINQINDAFNSLTDDEKSMIPLEDINIFWGKVKQISDYQAIVPVIQLLESLPNSIDNSESQFLSTYEAYQLLSSDQKALIDSQLINHLQNELQTLNSPEVPIMTNNHYFPWLSIIVLLGWSAAIYFIIKRK